jgi:hypothetical protein
MVGLIHREADLERLLSRWVETVEPDVITLELSSYGVSFRQSRGDELAGRLRATVEEFVAAGHCVDGPALDMLLAYIDLPSEFTCASDYAARRGVPLYLVDMDGHSRAHLNHMEELIARDNLFKLLCGPPAVKRDFEMAAARLFFEKGVSLLPYTEEMRARDRHMRDRIRGLMDSHGDARFLHICGWQHLRDPYGLYARLDPHKVFIHDKALRI